MHLTGAGLGVMMGIFLGAMGDMSPAIPIINGREAPQAPAMEQMRLAYRATFERCGHWARNFMALTGACGVCLVWWRDGGGSGGAVVPC